MTIREAIQARVKVLMQAFTEAEKESRITTDRDELPRIARAMADKVIRIEELFLLAGNLNIVDKIRWPGWVNL